MNISHTIQGVRNEYFESISHAPFIVKKMYINLFKSISHVVHCSKNVNISIANKKIRLRTENYSIRD